VSTISIRSTSDLDRVVATVGGGAIKGDCTTLIAVGGIGWPCGLIPPALEIVRDLGKGDGEESQDQKRGLAEHCCS
jgi:hypothetical protein